MNTPKKSVLLQGGCGYADLVIASKTGDAEALAVMARLLGFYDNPKPVADSYSLSQKIEFAVSRSEIPQKNYPEGLAPTPFWRLERCQFLKPLEEKKAVVQPEGRDTRPEQLPPRTRLNRWNVLAPRMRSHFTQQGIGKALDVDGVIRGIVRGETLHRLPRRSRRRWGSGIQIILDRSQRLIPFQDDQDWLALRLAALFPHQAVEYALALEELDAPAIVDRHGKWQDYRVPIPGTLVVMLGDLGCLAANSSRLMARWQRLGQDLFKGGCRGVVLTPCPVSRWRTEALRSWTMLPWVAEGEAIEPDAEELKARAEKLLTLLSPAIRIEPGLLRDIRLLLGNKADAGTEADVWTHPLMVGRSRVAGTLDPNEINRLRDGFAKEAKELQQKVVECIWRWRAGLSKDVWFDELLNIPQECLPQSIRENDLPAARHYFKQLPQEVIGSREGEAWYRRVSRRASMAFHNHGDQELKQAQDQMFAAAFRDDPAPPLPPGFELRSLPSVHDKPVSITVCHQGDQIIAGLTPHGGSLLGVIQSTQDLVQVLEHSLFSAHGHSAAGVLLNLQGEEKKARCPVPTGQTFQLETDCETLHFGRITRPTWAESMGRDGYGLWAGILISRKDGEPITQRLRWIPPGRFMMGSPGDEPERFESEGPRHEVNFEQGFWMFDTACTQELWQAVMGDNPSRLKFPNHPVEQVSFDDVQKFLEKINADHPGLELTLPSEAQWEYACRAGTTTPFSFGANITPAQVNYDGNFLYANGVKGESRKKTVPVASLPANSWGLYEMHGNVYECCADVWHDSYEGAPVDGSAWDGPSGERVIRGGSWFDHARRVRSACRNRSLLALRGTLGFRCVRVQS